ncbi:MAG: glucose 1-dehydrogenase [Hyphomicrobiales bacterium]
MVNEPGTLRGRVAVVTGASSGIGAAIARALSAKGAAVMIDYLGDPAPAEALVAELRAAGGDAAYAEADVSQPASVARLFAAIDARWGRLDILVNNAGIDGERQRGWEGTIDNWHSVLAVNLFGAYYCAREALSRMVPKGNGVIVSVSSVHEVIPWTGYSAYTTSKAGLSMLMKTLAQEAAPHGVRVACVAPGAIRTAINRAVWSDEETNADLLSKIPLGRIGATEEVASLVAYLASDAASYITGTTVFVDGGMTLYPSFEHGG